MYGRLANRVQITSDGHGPYTNAFRDIFGIDVDYAQLVKVYGQAPEAFKGRYSPAPFKSCHKTLRITPAMAAGVTDRLWEMSDLVAIVEAGDAKPNRPATYKKRA